jgi:hypothetical protein
LARHYSTKDFFRQMPYGLLARYLHARGLLGDLDFCHEETQPDELFDGEYSVAAAMIRELVDSATTANPRYTPSTASSPPFS